jgi:hypothetical protein
VRRAHGLAATNAPVSDRAERDVAIRGRIADE